MSEQWTWTYADSAGSDIDVEAATATAFPSQADAENWFGETWRELADAGVSEVSLYRDGELVYGPMSLESTT